MAKAAKKFEQTTGVRATEKEDAVGSVVVQVRHADTRSKGNITRAMTLKNCKVSEVFEAIKAALVE